MIVFLADNECQDTITQTIGPALQRTEQHREIIIEQPCQIVEASEYIHTLIVDAPPPWIGIIELHERGVGVFVSRASKGFALLIPYWRFNLSKGEKSVALFNGEHFLRILPQNEDLGGFTRNLVAAKIAADQQAGSPTW